jgi:hypothetical protein
MNEWNVFQHIMQSQFNYIRIRSDQGYVNSKIENFSFSVHLNKFCDIFGMNVINILMSELKSVLKIYIYINLMIITKINVR